MGNSKPTAIVNGYAIFAGGDDGSGYSDTVDVFSVGSAGELTAVAQDSGIKLSVGRYGLASAVVGNYILFAGGNAVGGRSDAIDVYKVNDDGTLTVVTQPGDIKLSEARDALSSAVVGNYAIFAGGRAVGSSGKIDVFGIDPDSGEVIRHTQEYLRVGRYGLASGVVGNHAIFAGGYSAGTYSDAIEVFGIDPDSGEVIRHTDGYLRVGRADLASAVVGNHVIFAGGVSGSFDSFKVVDVFEVDPDTGVLTSTGQDIKLSVGRFDLVSGVVRNYVLFAGGNVGGNYSNAIDVYKVNDDGTLTVVTQSGDIKLSVHCSYLASVVVGNYVLFAGGHITGPAYSATIDVISVGVPTYELKYAFGDGDNPDIELPEDEVVEWGTEPELPTPETVPGYEFQGWTDDKKGFWEHLEDVPQTGSQILYAQYEEILTKRKERSNAKKHV
jgi:6-phosphogluconolactonase (cycloisomerase 2 family)